MTKTFNSRAVCRLSGLLLMSFVLHSLPVRADSAVALHEKFLALQVPLSQNQFKRALVLESVETSDGMRGDVYGVVDYPFGMVSEALNNPNHWCELLILHINTKYCRASAGPAGTSLRIHIGKKTPESLATASRVDLLYSVATLAPDFFEIELHAKDGPLGTSDYRILLTGIAVENDKTFLHLTYSYAANWFARLAMQTYLGTVGRGKVGFTQIGLQGGGQPVFVGGVRALVERNTMRYYLAIDSFLASMHAVPEQQLERRLQYWFTAVEQYPQQLHDMERPEYLEMKRAEYLRQQTGE